MAWYRCGGGGIPSSLKGDMNDVFNKKFGTVLQDYPPEDWPGTVNLMGPLPEKTVSGSVVTFSDGADDVPIKSWEVALPASLSGYSSLSCVNTGKNLANIYAIESCSNTGGAGSSITQNNDGSITIVTTTQQNVKSLQKFGEICPNVKVGETYTLTATTTGTQKQIYLHGVSTLWTYGQSKTITEAMLTSEVSFYASGNNTTATISDLMLRPSVYTDATYAPYVAPTTYTASLDRTIYGGSVDVVNGTGTDENGNDFTFTPVPILSRLGDNTMWGDGDLSVTYRRDIDLALAQ